MEPALESKKKFLGPVVIVVLAVGILALAGVSYYFYSQYSLSQMQLKNPTLAAQQEIKSLIAQVGSLIELPSGEVPTVATVSDPAKLAGQQFFANAKKGDKVLIYTQAKKAILYRPSQNKIVDVAPVNLGAS